MAAAAAAVLLDELMGRNRNAVGETSSDISWDDPKVCRSYLCGFCPHDLFINTRADLGACSKIHDDALRKEYQESSRCGNLGYEEDFQRFLQQLVSDVEKRIRRGHQRLALSNNNLSYNPPPKEEKIAMLTEKINELVQQAEELGCQSKVEEAQGVMKLCEQLREERSGLESRSTSNSEDPEKMMEVCDICGALLVVNDVQQRVDEHILGKQHSGYARIRSYLDGQRQKKEEDAQRAADLIKEKEEREAEREKERQVRRDKEREREKERQKEKERDREKKRDRERDRDRPRHRSRSRSRDRRRSKDRKKRSRSRSRDHHHRSRSKDRHRRRRSRSRSHSKKSDKKRSRSRSRKRSRSRDRRSREHRGDKRDSKSKESADCNNIQEDRPSHLEGQNNEINDSSSHGDNNVAMETMSHLTYGNDA